MKKSLRQVIGECGEDYMELVRSGISTREVAEDAGYSCCDSCGDWEEAEAMAITSGMSGDLNICEHCLECKSKSKKVQSAIRGALDDQKGNDEWNLKKYLNK